MLPPHFVPPVGSRTVTLESLSSLVNSLIQNVPPSSSPDILTPKIFVNPPVVGI